MGYWNFTSPDNWYTLELPANWAEYDDEDNVSAFFNTEQWSGNLRITALRWPTDTEIDKTSEYIASELNDNAGAICTKLGEMDAAFYTKEAANDCIIYYWVTGKENNLFLCSFTIDKSFFNTARNTEELTIVENMLNTLKVLV
jgi:hypothetical protein